MAKTIHVIEEKEVRQLLKKKEEMKAYEGALAVLKEQVSELESKIYKALNAGAETSHLTWDLKPKIIQRRFPAWKAWFCHYMGEKAAAKILAKTTPVNYYHVLIRKKVKVLG
jgi:hypothetical protein